MISLDESLAAGKADLDVTTPGFSSERTAGRTWIRTAPDPLGPRNRSRRR